MRPLALTIPAVTVSENPNGLPIATTQSPTARLAKPKPLSESAPRSSQRVSPVAPIVTAVAVGTVRDHVAPWRSTYAATQLYTGPVKFVLSASGHIAGGVNPPGSKYGHWQNDANPPSPDLLLVPVEAL